MALMALMALISWSLLPAWSFDDPCALLVGAQNAARSLDAVRQSRFLHGAQHLALVGAGKGD